MIDKSQLNLFEIKAEINKIFERLNGVNDFDSYEIHLKTLDAQKDKNVIVKLLFKEIYNPNNQLVKFLLERYCRKEDLIEKLWEIIKNPMTTNKAKIFALDFLRDIDTNWTYEDCNECLDNPNELIELDTQRILTNAITNPEVRIDFMDFISTLSDDDKITLLNSLGNDYEKDELANMVIPVFLWKPTSEFGKAAIDILGNSKSQLAYHALSTALESADNSIKSLINKNLSILKLAGIREDNSLEYYKNILKDSKPYKFCITYPDGHGNQAIIISRLGTNGKVRFVAIVIDDYKGIKDCFGFNEISKFECNTIIERFYRGQRALDLEPGILKNILLNAEKLNFENISYEYICWKTQLLDIETTPIKLDLKIKKLTWSEFESILKYDFTDYWFLNENYSDEFEEFIKLAETTEPKDYEEIIEENLEKVFYKEEAEVWTKRILNTAVLKYYANEKKAAQNLYSLYNDKELIRELFKNIIRKSIYEYFFKKKDLEKVQAIEDMWVK